jgi:hypothetical protein
MSDKRLMSGVPGVNWITVTGRWGVFGMIDGQQVSLLTFPEPQLTVAIDMRKEFETLPKERLDEHVEQLKEKYRLIREQVMNGFEYKPRKFPDLPITPAGQSDPPGEEQYTLTQLLHKAKQADKNSLRLKKAADDAKTAYDHSISEAKAAWNAYAEALVDTYPSVGFQASKLGKLLGGG